MIYLIYLPEEISISLARSSLPLKQLTPPTTDFVKHQPPQAKPSQAPTENPTGQKKVPRVKKKYTVHPKTLGGSYRGRNARQTEEVQVSM